MENKRLKRTISKLVKKPVNSKKAKETYEKIVLGKKSNRKRK